MFSTSTHEAFMQKCIALGRIAGKNGESPVGSVIVRNGEIVGEGMEQSKRAKDITFHAEIVAIRHATQQLRTQDLSDCILYTTHEPCIMCSYIIRHAKIHTVVTGLSTGEIGGFSSAFPILRDTSIKHWGSAPVIVTGVLADECRKLYA